MLKEGPLPPKRVEPEPTKKSVEACLVGDTCSPFTKCPATASRDCLRASVPFRTPLRRISCCFRCCVNTGSTQQDSGGTSTPRARACSKSRRAPRQVQQAEPRLGRFWIGASQNVRVLAHPHMFAAVSDVHVHPMTGCRVVDEKDFDASFILLAALYHVDPNRALRSDASPAGLRPGEPI